MINKNTYIVYDYETTSANPYTTQPIELAAVAVDPRNLEIIPNSEFYSLIRPIEDKEEQIKMGLGPIEQGALDVNKKTLEELRTAPSVKSVWESFKQYCMNYNITGKKWDAPILCGYNNTKFDDIITDRIAGKEPWGYGPFDKDRQQCTLFHPIHNVDIMKYVFGWFESDYELKSFSMDNLRVRLNMSSEGAHHAMKDVKDTAQLLIGFLKLQRKMKNYVNDWK